MVKTNIITNWVEVWEVVGNKGTDLEEVIGSNPGGQKRLMGIAEGCISLLKIIVEKISHYSKIYNKCLYPL